MTEVEKLQAQLDRMREDLTQKETKIAKLKGLLTRSMRSDKRREQEVETLHIDLSDRDRRLHALTVELEEANAFSSRQSDRITSLEKDLDELTRRIQSGVGSEAAQRRSERSQQMLERSNALYAQLENKFHNVERENEELRSMIERHNTVRRAIVLSDEDGISLREDGSYELFNPQTFSGEKFEDFRQNTSQQTTKSKDAHMKAYLRNVFLEFLVGEPTTQTRLIPVILQLLGCTPQQTEAAIRCYVEGNQIISKASAVFGL